ncbi:MAG: hypothetical protein JXR52_08555 [Bacteroidales bacterium]|nr:hypothetical protein [Bacteroidales bacterium]
MEWRSEINAILRYADLLRWGWLDAMQGRYQINCVDYSLLVFYKPDIFKHKDGNYQIFPYY